MSIPLAAVRETRGVTQSWLADAVGVSSRTIRRIENDSDYDPGFSVMARISLVLGCSLEDLYVHEAVNSTDGNGHGREGRETHESPTTESPQIHRVVGLR